MKIIRWENPPRNEMDEVRDTIQALARSPYTWALIVSGVPSGEAAEAEDLLLDVGVGCVETKITEDEDHAMSRSLYARFVPRDR